MISGQDCSTPSTLTALTGALNDFKKRQTTAAEAEKVEEGPDNPFTLSPFGRNYFDILKARREVPVHAQRYGNAS